MLFRQPLHSFLLESLAPYDRTVRLDDDSPFPTPLYDVGPREPRVQFPLPDADLSALTFAVLPFEVLDVGLQLGEMVDAVVGDADGADEAGAFGFDESEPGAVAGCGAAVGGVD